MPKKIIKHGSKNKNKYGSKSKNKLSVIIYKISIILIFIITLNSLSKKKMANSNEIIKMDKHKILSNVKEIYSINYSNIGNNYDNYRYSKCVDFDPIKMINKTLNNKPKVICQYEKSNHICYPNTYPRMFEKKGIICKMENIILDPSKWRDGGVIYKGPINISKGNIPFLSHGFFNMKCKNQSTIETNSKYEKYLNAWNYNYDYNIDKEEELAVGKTIFFLSRNSDSPNMFHGLSEVINVMAIMYLLNLTPEDIKIVLLESFKIEKDIFYDIYKNIFSRGGEIVHIRNLKKKYHITSGVHIPINMDSPCFILDNPPQCKYPTFTFQLLSILIDKYMNIEEFEDKFINIDKMFYYPNSTINNHNLGKKFKKNVTILWRNVWPEGRKGQKRILGNSKELTDNLALALPDDILVRLVDTAKLSISQQIAIMRKTDYLTGNHGAAFVLSVFTPINCIIHEFLTLNHYEQQLQALSGHKFYSSNIKYKQRIIDDNEYLFLDSEDFIKSILNLMKENNFTKIN